NATSLKNNLGKYLRAAAREEIVITSNGRKVARLSAYEDEPAVSSTGENVMETAESYSVWPKKATYEEFLEIWENTDDRYEYIDGEIYLLASPKTAHQQALGELYGFMYNWFKGKKCKPMLAPYDITLKRNADNINIVQPDLMVICDLEENLNEKNYYMGVPSLMVEILSEGSIGKDAVKKLDLYMSTGVQEYWIVNTFSKEINVYLFENFDVAKNITFMNEDMLTSYIFEGLEISLKEIIH
ncbi:MAG: type II toxin-antitoxin system prevent-host-death family antitoxin, partial [Eubacteriales bacterium]|nr:type II toxin-antitoxin system prevent-host-death family antitoxin [Eubacteriales bacterium]